MDAGALRQIERCLADDEAWASALCADHHLGAIPCLSAGIIAYENAVAPSGVGYDIACGNKAARTNLKPRTFARIFPASWTPSFKIWHSAWAAEIPPLDHALFDDPGWGAPFLKLHVTDQIKAMFHFRNHVLSHCKIMFSVK